jgi:isoamylase
MRKRSQPPAAVLQPVADLEPAPGVERTPEGHRFTLFAPHANKVELLVNAGRPHSPFTGHFALEAHRRGDASGGSWTSEIGGLPDRFEYAYRLDDGPELIDPYARLLSGGETWGDRSWETRSLRFRTYRALWTARTTADTAGERPPRPRIDDGERVIYELHVRGFTRHESSAVNRPGTYLGIVEKIPYLKSLGVTTVELLPIFEFDETENFRTNPATGERLLNFWGYSPITFFAPKRSYAAGAEPGAELDELCRLVDELHLAGMEIVLDVVYNHTAEGGGGRRDPLRSFRALAEDVYYVREATGKAFDCTGCGNTVNTNHPVVRRMILDSLRYWAGEVGVDGFRFDLASVFYRGLAGEKLEMSPIVHEIGADPLLAQRLLIAEPWDISGFSPPHGFPPPWKEWNGAFRDTLRRYIRGDEVSARTLALRVGGSPDRVPSGAAPRPDGSTIDFVACHDGFTLEDLVSYERKRNHENGEENQDGSSFNLSSNHDAEGATESPEIAALRARQVRNFLALLFLTRGTPMLLAGDERGRTQGGNNNAWCQDNATGWVDWSAEKDDRVELVRRLAALRRELAGLPLDRHAEMSPFANLTPTTAAPAGRAGLLLFRAESGDGLDLALVLNPTDLPARLPAPRSRAGRPWRLAIDTQSHGAAAVPEPGSRPELASETAELELAPRSLRLLLAGG